jgi:hypothetical protein
VDSPLLITWFGHRGQTNVFIRDCRLKSPR